MLQRTKPSEDEQRLRSERDGFRLIIPVMVWFRRDYDPRQDAFVSGLWTFIVAPAVARLGGHGVVFRLTWGWMTSAAPEAAA